MMLQSNALMLKPKCYKAAVSAGDGDEPAACAAGDADDAGCSSVSGYGGAPCGELELLVVLQWVLVLVLVPLLNFWRCCSLAATA